MTLLSCPILWYMNKNTFKPNITLLKMALKIEVFMVTTLLSRVNKKIAVVFNAYSFITSLILDYFVFQISRLLVHNRIQYSTMRHERYISKCCISKNITHLKFVEHFFFLLLLLLLSFFFRKPGEQIKQLCSMV